MRIGVMFRDTLDSLFHKPVTQRYPFERKPTPERLHGKLVWNNTKCTGCALCTKDCPANAIEMVVNDKPNKTFVLRYRMDRCIFCAQCVQNCRFSCLEMSNQWEMASLNRDPFTLYYGAPENVQAYLQAQAPDEPVEQCAAE
jgi:formate hydrogenlyase subunit 6/NADH:ubiquinone oxidoreductase subunit I